jgi:alanyl-tRNA synthetase
MPSNEERGYVLRRIMRRAIRHGVKLGMTKPFMQQTTERVIDDMADTYPELAARRDFILKVVSNEEDAFRLTLDRGLALLDEVFANLSAENQSTLSGKTVFELHDTFGFPPDLTEVIAAERAFEVDMEGYKAHMSDQRARSRASWKGSGESAVADTYRELENDGATEFTGYQDTASKSTVLALLVNGTRVESASAGQQVEVITTATPFYAESGGQVGDTGVLQGPAGRVDVFDCLKPAGAVFVHSGKVTEGLLSLGDDLSLQVNPSRRQDIMRNHTATHLLHAALRSLLGKHVQQKGSLVDPDRLRFDFSHFEAIPEETLCAIEDLVNEQILADAQLSIFETDMDGARAQGAMALFGEKYGDNVRVVQVPGFSTELCGGTHCDATGQIGLLKITSEAGIASGVRRIEALTGRRAFQYLRQLETEQRSLSTLLKAGRDETVTKVERLLEDRKVLRRQVEDLKQKLISGGSDGDGPQPRDVQGVPVLAAEIEGVDSHQLRAHSDLLLEKLGSGVVVLAARSEGKATLLVKISKELTDRLRAGDLVRELAQVVGGKGGGRPDMAQAGGKLPENIPAALEKAYEMVGDALS